MRSPSRENKERMVKNQGDDKACERERYIVFFLGKSFR
jgi:hypothetical protein